MIVTDGLIAYYNYNQGFGGGVWENLAPATKGQYNGTVSGATLQPDGVAFDGVDDYVNTHLSLTSDPFSIDTFIIPSSASGWRGIIGDGQGNGIRLTISLGVVVASYSDVAAQTGIYAVTADELNHICVTFDGNTLRLYINASMHSERAVPEPVAQTQPLQIGIAQDASNFSGRIPAARVYNKALTETEILQNYEFGTDIGLPDDDDPEPPIGEEGTAHFDMRQVVHSESAADFDTAQAIFDQDNVSADTKQQIYETGSRPFDSHQTIYQAGSALFDTEQAMYRAGTVSFDTLQRISEGMSGSGTEEDPYIIETYAHLLAMRDNLYQTHYALGADIDASPSWEEGAAWEPPEADFEESSFDGRGYKIKNLRIVSNITTANMGNGFFSTVYKSTVKNIHFENTYIEAPFRVGIVAGGCWNSTIENVMVTGAVYDFDYYGGALVGYIDRSIGEAHTLIENCHAEAAFYPTDAYTDPEIGGIAGRNQVLANEVTIRNCLVIFTNSLDVDPDSTGGILGGAEGLEYVDIQNCYYNAEMLLQSNGTGEGKTDEELRNQGTYQGWDFETVWGIHPSINDGFPYLQLFQKGIPGTVQFDVSQVIYEEGTHLHDTRQTLFRTASDVYDTKLSLYKVGTVSFDTLQVIVSTGIPGTSHFDMRLSLYARGSWDYDTKQAYYREITSRYDLKQALYEAGRLGGDVNLIIYADGSETADLLQTIYQTGATQFDTRQVIFNPDKSLIGTVKLEGRRQLNVYLSGEQSPDTSLEGIRELDVRLKGVIK